MQETATRYHPEFLIRIQIDGEDSGDTVEVVPSPSSASVMENYGLRARSIPGGLLAFLRLRRSGSSWVPAVALEEPHAFSFWLTIRSAGLLQSLDFFSTGSTRLGRQIFYANNLTAAGAIDANMVDGVVSLTSAAQASDGERGALSTYLWSASVAPGEFTSFEAGPIVAGGPVNFSLSAPVQPFESTVAVDFTQLRKGAYLVRLEGSSTTEERVVPDQKAASARVHGIIDIFRDTWHLPPQPREYQVDFASS